MFLIVFGMVVLAGCAASVTESPTPTQIDLTAVTSALRASGIAVAEVADNLNSADGAWQCLPGSFRYARVLQQPPAAFARPGDRPAVEILLFTTDAERAAAQAAIDAGGQVRAPGCGVAVDWVATPHVIAARNVLLFVATDDQVTLAAVRAAAGRLAP